MFYILSFYSRPFSLIQFHHPGGGGGSNAPMIHPGCRCRKRRLHQFLPGGKKSFLPGIQPGIQYKHPQSGTVQITVFLVERSVPVTIIPLAGSGRRGYGGHDDEEDEEESHEDTHHTDLLLLVKILKKKKRIKCLFSVNK